MWQKFTALVSTLLADFQYPTTFSRLRRCPDYWATIWFLFWPVPWKFRLPPLLDPIAIRDDRLLVHRRYYVETNHRALRGMPIFRFRDTPLRCLYRIVDCISATEENYTMLDFQYFFRQQTWPLKDIPDPKDPNPLLLAATIEVMVEQFNIKIFLGLRRGRPKPPFRSIDDLRNRFLPGFTRFRAWMNGFHFILKG
ncbi:hypothetical protein CPB85DRAFT_1247282 [Mucidula mucida]|nr:hypothetical protein CPB85DRAFT_1247282 [Mucidula mucida]